MWRVTAHLQGRYLPEGNLENKEERDSVEENKQIVWSRAHWCFVLSDRFADSGYDRGGNRIEERSRMRGHPSEDDAPEKSRNPLAVQQVEGKCCPLVDN